MTDKGVFICVSWKSLKKTCFHRLTYHCPKSWRFFVLHLITLQSSLSSITTANKRTKEGNNSLHVHQKRPDCVRSADQESHQVRFLTIRKKGWGERDRG